MLIPKPQARAIHRFHLVDPSELDTFEEWAEWLEALLHNPCSIFERGDELLLLESKQHVARVNGLKIEVFSNEHPPPHFHVKAPEIDASFSIEDCSLLKGKISSPAAQKVKYWHLHSKPKLIEAWNSSRPTNCTVGPYTGA
jgi:Domain of unknown function (DUF4160)